MKSLICFLVLFPMFSFADGGGNEIRFWSAEGDLSVGSLVTIKSPSVLVNGQQMWIHPDNHSAQAICTSVKGGTLESFEQSYTWGRKPIAIAVLTDDNSRVAATGQAADYITKVFCLRELDGVTTYK